MGRVGQRLVAAEQRPEGVRFYDQPKPYGHWLCRVNVYWVPQKIVTGEEVRGQDWWADDLSVQRRYGIWRRPSAGGSSDEARHKACVGFKAFDTTFEAAGDPPEPERAVFLLERLIMAARAGGPLPFPVMCRRWAKHGETPQRCDGMAILRGVSLRDLGYAKVISFDHGKKFGSSRDELRIGSRAHEDVTLTVDSRQHWGRHSIAEGEVRSVAVVVDASH